MPHAARRTPHALSRISATPRPAPPAHRLGRIRVVVLIRVGIGPRCLSAVAPRPAGRSLPAGPGADEALAAPVPSPLFAVAAASPGPRRDGERGAVHGREEQRVPAAAHAHARAANNDATAAAAAAAAHWQLEMR